MKPTTIFYIIGLMFLLGSHFYFSLMFLNAYKNNNQVLVNINKSNEANVELIALVASFPIIIFTLVRALKYEKIHQEAIT
jgi:hypothetical protein